MKRTGRTGPRGALAARGAITRRSILETHAEQQRTDQSGERRSVDRYNPPTRRSAALAGFYSETAVGHRSCGLARLLISFLFHRAGSTLKHSLPDSRGLSPHVSAEVTGRGSRKVNVVPPP